MGPHPHGIVKGEIIGFQPRSPAGPGRPTMNSASEALRWEWSEEITPWIENNGYSYSWYSYIVVYLCGIHPCRSICCRSAFIPESSSRTLQASPQDLEESDRSPSFTRATCGYRGFLDTGKKKMCFQNGLPISTSSIFHKQNIGLTYLGRFCVFQAIPTCNLTTPTWMCMRVIVSLISGLQPWPCHPWVIAGYGMLILSPIHLKHPP